jgi:glutaredoxin
MTPTALTAMPAMTVYTSANCPKCRVLKRKLAAHPEVVWVEEDAKEPTVAAFLERAGIRALPAVRLEDGAWLAFHEVITRLPK